MSVYLKVLFNSALILYTILYSPLMAMEEAAEKSGNQHVTRSKHQQKKARAEAAREARRTRKQAAKFRKKVENRRALPTQLFGIGADCDTACPAAPGPESITITVSVGNTGAANADAVSPAAAPVAPPRDCDFKAGGKPVSQRLVPFNEEDVIRHVQSYQVLPGGSSPYDTTYLNSLPGRAGIIAIINRIKSGGEPPVGWQYGSVPEGVTNDDIFYTSGYNMSLIADAVCEKNKQARSSQMSAAQKQEYDLAFAIRYAPSARQTSLWLFSLGMLPSVIHIINQYAISPVVRIPASAIVSTRTFQNPSGVSVASGSLVEEDREWRLASAGRNNYIDLNACYISVQPSNNPLFLPRIDEVDCSVQGGAFHIKYAVREQYISPVGNMSRVGPWCSLMSADPNAAVYRYQPVDNTFQLDRDLLQQSLSGPDQIYIPFSVEDVLNYATKPQYNSAYLTSLIGRKTIQSIIDDLNTRTKPLPAGSWPLPRDLDTPANQYLMSWIAEEASNQQPVNVATAIAAAAAASRATSRPLSKEDK